MGVREPALPLPAADDEEKGKALFLFDLKDAEFGLGIFDILKGKEVENKFSWVERVSFWYKLMTVIWEWIKKVLYSKDYQKKLIQNGYNKVSKFSWNNCAKSTLEIYKKVDE